MNTKMSEMLKMSEQNFVNLYIQEIFSCLTSAIETLENGVKYVQSKQ